MQDFEPPMSSDPMIRINALEVVIRAILSSLPPEQLRESHSIAERSFQKMMNEPTFQPEHIQATQEIADMVRFIYAHVNHRL